MKRFLYCLILFATTHVAYAQFIIQGSVTDAFNEALPGASVYIEGTYDGATADEKGEFQFSTSEDFPFEVTISFLGFHSHRRLVSDNDELLIHVNLREEVSQLKSVVVTPGSFVASDEVKAAQLKPMDIVTTAGALGDFNGALTTLPGTSVVGESGRLFVRGGDDSETGVYIDGSRVHQPYESSIPNIGSRGRFSPFLFKGTFFSTGGYSAEYGQAMSSILALETKEIPEIPETNLSVMAVGLEAKHSRKFEKDELHAELAYYNLDPLFSLIPQNYSWEKAPESVNGLLFWRRSLNDRHQVQLFTTVQSQKLGLYKTYQQEQQLQELKNDYAYFNIGNKGIFGKGWSYTSGLSFTYNLDDRSLDGFSIKETEHDYGARLLVEKETEQDLTLKMGAEWLSYNRNFEVDTVTASSNIISSFAEARWAIDEKVGLIAGLRQAYAKEASELRFMPRFTLMYHFRRNQFLSFSYGNFYQSKRLEQLLVSPDLSMSKAQHWIASYQLEKNNRLLRIEAYWKNYSSLPKYESGTLITSTGYGESNGVDMWFRDQKTIKNADFWISYSWINAKRNYLHYPNLAPLDYVAEHNFSIVYKHFVPVLKSQLGFVWQYNSGRPYHEPGDDTFNARKTDFYGSLNLNWAYLFRQHIILYASVNNVLGRQNVFGYEYIPTDVEDSFDRSPILPTSNRFFFIGLFITLSKNLMENQLDTL